MDRWQRLADRLTDAGITAKVDARSYRGGVTRSIGLLLPDGRYVHIADQWWRKNDRVWLGYAVTIENRDSIIIKSWPPTKKPAAVVACVTSVASEHLAAGG